MDITEMVEKHWAYVESVIRSEWKAFAITVDCDPHLVDSHCEIIGHHYRTAMFHGYKHGVEDSTKSIQKPETHPTIDEQVRRHTEVPFDGDVSTQEDIKAFWDKRERVASGE